MEVGNITKAATFESFLFLSYKNTQSRNDRAFQYFHETNINRLFFGVTQKYELRVSFKVELGGKVIKVFVGIRSKTLAYLMDDDSEHKKM